MNIDLKVKNIVLVGIFNPSLFDKYFFIKNEIVKEEEILDGSIFGVMGGMQLVCSRFHIVISLNQIIISSTNPESDSDEISGIILSFVKAGNIANVTALGINFHWFLEEKSKSLEEISKDFFYNDKLELFKKFFNSSDSMFGAYASINFKDSRLKLDIKPNKIQDNNRVVVQNIISFAFNFHFDIKNFSDNTELLHILEEYGLYREEGERIISIYK
jgi:hypothetical protein